MQSYSSYLPDSILQPGDLDAKRPHSIGGCHDVIAFQKAGYIRRANCQSAQNQ
jgi:hypothetical protein